MINQSLVYLKKFDLLTQIIYKKNNFKGHDIIMKDGCSLNW